MRRRSTFPTSLLLIGGIDPGTRPFYPCALRGREWRAVGSWKLEAESLDGIVGVRMAVTVECRDGHGRDGEEERAIFAS